MLQALFVLFLFVFVTGLCTLASVLLARFFLPKLNRDLRIVMAGTGGAFWIWGPLAIYMLVTEGLRDSTTLIFFGFIAIGFVVIGWPVSFVATRKLDQLVAYDPDIFK